MEEFPEGEGDELAEGGCAGAVGGGGWVEKVEGPLEMGRWAGEGDGVRPGDVSAGVGGDVGFEFDSFMAVSNAVFAGGVAMPDGPPTTMLHRECFVGGGWAQEMATVGASGGGCGVGLGEVHLNEGAVGAQGLGRAIGDEE